VVVYSLRKLISPLSLFILSNAKDLSKPALPPAQARPAGYLRLNRKALRPSPLHARIRHPRYAVRCKLCERVPVTKIAGGRSSEEDRRRKIACGKFAGVKEDP
jgi:hypothetical protein